MHGQPHISYIFSLKWGKKCPQTAIICNFKTERIEMGKRGNGKANGPTMRGGTELNLCALLMQGNSKMETKTFITLVVQFE